MTTNYGNDPAFPAILPGSYDYPGMTLRDYFAGQALVGLASTDINFGTVGNPCDPWSWVAEESYKAADAMLKARES